MTRRLLTSIRQLKDVAGRSRNVVYYRCWPSLHCHLSRSSTAKRSVLETNLAFIVRKRVRKSFRHELFSASIDRHQVAPKFLYTFHLELDKIGSLIDAFCTISMMNMTMREHFK